MESSFSWLDFSERERRKALDIIEQFRDEDTRDELGIGTIRNALADLLFPGTSTIQTRARYFLFVPWTYLRLEGSRVGYPEVSRRARQAELKLIDALATAETEGVIGSISRGRLQRLPSNIYWAGLRTWGIHVFDRSQDEYHSWLNRYYSEIKRTGGQETGGDRRLMTSANWHANLPLPPEGFPDDVNFLLRSEEAEYLSDRIRQRVSKSLLAYMVGHRVESPAVDFPWLLPVVLALPRELGRIIEHARHFSEIMLGAALLYNLLLADSRSEFADTAALYRQRLSGWWEGTAVTRARLSGTTLPSLWETLGESQDHRVPPRTRTFVTRWYQIVQNSHTIASISDGVAVRDLVRERERQLKGVRARIGNDKMLVNWNGSSGSAQLDYRWKVASRMIDDIVTAL